MSDATAETGEVPESDARDAPDAPDARNDSRSWPRRLALWASVASLAAVLVPVVARQTGWEAGPLAYAVSFMPWVTLACVVPLAFAALAGSRVLAVAALVPFVACVAWLVPIYAASSVAGASDAGLRVATINATLGRAYADDVVAMVKDHSIDVLAVEELTPAEVDDLRAAGIDDELPYSELAPQRGVEGTGLWSRLKMDSQESVRGLTSHAVRATVAVGPENVAIYAVHPAAPGMFDHSRWADDMKALAGIVEPNDGPVIVAGDFNTTRDHRSFRDLEALGFKDAVDEAGAGFLPTFPNGRLPMPVVAIDHLIIRGSSLAAVSAQTVAIPGADHRALVITYMRQE